jgi:hypothetical protein
LGPRPAPAQRPLATPSGLPWKPPPNHPWRH